MRVLIAFVLLVLFPLFAILLVIACLALMVVALLSDDLSRAGQLPALFGTVTLLALGAGLIASPSPLPPAVPVDPRIEPRLWELVRDVARQVGTRPPDRVRLVAEPNAWVFETGGWFGLWRGIRHLDIGLPLLAVLDTGQLRAVVAHELGHYRRGRVGLAGLVYRGHTAMSTVSESLPPSPMRWLLRMHRSAYWLVASGELREHEWAADRAAVAATGRATVHSAWTEVEAAGEVWAAYLALVASGSRAVPADLSGAFGLFRRSPEGVEVVRRLTPAPASPGDTHPPMAERIAAVFPDEIVERHEPPASSVVDHWSEHTRRIDDLLLGDDPRGRVRWEDHRLELARENAEVAADRLLAAAWRIGASPGVDGVLALLGTSSQALLAKEVLRADPLGAPSRVEGPVLVDHLAAAMRVALAGVDGWRIGVDQRVHVVDDTGEVVDVVALAKGAVEGLEGAARARTKVVGRPAMPPRDDLRRVRVLGAIGPVAVNGKPFILVVMPTGLVLLRVVYDRSTPEAEVARLRRAGVVSPDTWFVGYDAIAALAVKSRRRLHAEVELVSRARLSIRWTTETRALGGRNPRLLLAAVAAVLAKTGAPRPDPTVPRVPVAGVPVSSEGIEIAGAEAARNLRWRGVVFLSTAALLLITAVGVGPPAAVLAVFTGISGLFYLTVGTVRELGPAERGCAGYALPGTTLLFGALVLIGLVRRAPAGLSWGTVLFGVALIVLGLLRLAGSLPRARGNVLKVAGVAAATVGLGHALDLVATGSSRWVLLIAPLAPVLYGFGGLVGKLSRRRATTPRLGPAENPAAAEATTTGLIALLASWAGPVGVAMGVLAINRARRAGVRPYLGVAAVVIGLLSMVVVVVLANHL